MEIKPKPHTHTKKGGKNRGQNICLSRLLMIRFTLFLAVTKPD